MLASNAPIHPGCPSLFAGALLGAALVMSASATARADGLPDAEVLFRDGIQLLKAGKPAQACPKLAESQRLDPAVGTEFRLAECYETLGRLASAWAIFNDVADKSRAADRPDQEKKARARADALTPKLSTLTVNVPDAVARLSGLDVRRDDVSLGRASWGTPIPVDSGKHTVRVTAAKTRPWVREVEVQQAAENVAVTVSRLDEAADAGGSPLVEPDAGGGKGSEGGGVARPLAFVAGGLALAGIGVGATFGLLALSKDSDWTQATGDHCDRQLQCDPAYTSSIEAIEQDRSRFATLSTIGLIAGGASAVGAVVLWLMAPSSQPPAQPSLRVGPMLGSVNGAVLRGSF